MRATWVGFSCAAGTPRKDVCRQASSRSSGSARWLGTLALLAVGGEGTVLAVEADAWPWWGWLAVPILMLGLTATCKRLHALANRSRG